MTLERGEAEPVLEARALTGVGTPPAFHDVDVTVTVGEGVALVGPSGGGKTRLMRALVGLDPVAHGRVAWFGRRCGTTRDFRAVRSRLGVVFEEGGLLASERVDVNVAWGLGERGRGAERPEVSDVLSLLELRAAAYPEQLTPWERKRVGLARALVARPEVLLLDGVFDAATTTRLDRLISRAYWPDVPLPARLWFTSHVPRSAMASERLVLIGAGGTLADGPRDEVLASTDPDVQLVLGHHWQEDA